MEDYLKTTFETQAFTISYTTSNEANYFPNYIGRRRMNLSESLKYAPLTAMGLLYLLDLSGLKGLELAAALVV
jgi:hypothetical protein